jgi:hypothetical protein
MNRQIGINSIVSGYYMMVAYDSYLLMVLYQSMNSYNPMDYQLDHCNTSPMVIFFMLMIQLAIHCGPPTNMICGMVETIG